MAKEVKNYLKSVKDITAPLNWKSAPDSPPTQLAYIMIPEIDMLVKANIHGSMNGKPNKGPKGIISLDGMGAYDSDSVVSKPDQKKYEAAGGASQSSYDTGQSQYTTQDDKNYQDEQNISGGTNNPVSGVSFGDEMGVTTQPKDKTTQPKEDKKFTIQDTFNFFSKFSPLAAGGKLFGAGVELLFGTKPKANQFTDANDLAIIRSLFTNEKGEVDTDKLNEYYDNYKITIGEGLTSDEASGEAAKFFEEKGIVDNEKAFKDFQNAIAGADSPQGSEAQRRLDPEAYYDRDLFLSSGEQAEMLKDYPKFLLDLGLKPLSSRFANTSGNLADIASIDVNMTTEDGKPLSKEFKQKIFDARMQLDSMGRDMFGNKNMPTQTSGGGGGTYVPPTTTPDDPMIPQDPTLPPGVMPPTTTPKYPGSVVTDYTQLGLPNIYGNQQMPNYATFNRQGSIPVGLQDYLDNLRKRFGIG